MATSYSDNSVKVFDLRPDYLGRIYGNFQLFHNITAIATNGRYIAIATATGNVSLNLLWGIEIKKYQIQ